MGYEMRVIRVPKAVLTAEIQAGRVTLFRMMGSVGPGVAGRIADAVATAGLEEAGSGAAGAALQWPACCCKCLRKGSGIRPVESTSIVNKGIDYTFRFAVPHCAQCAGTANRKRAGTMGLIAVGLAIAVPVIIVMIGIGAATNRDSLIFGSLLVGPALGYGLPRLWRKARGGSGGPSPYQALYVSDLEGGMAGAPVGFSITFENASYASQFVALNRAAGVAPA